MSFFLRIVDIIKKQIALLFFLLFSTIVNSQCNTIYVTPTGSGIGSKLSPTNLSNALIIASPGDHLKLSTGLFFTNTILSIPNNIIIEGGYLIGSNWTKTSFAGATYITRTASAIRDNGTPYARISVFELTNAIGFRFQDLTIEVNNAPLGSSFGVSTYGIYLNNCSNYKIVICQITAGNASQGNNGSSGANGAWGNNGWHGRIGKPNDKVANNGGFGGTGGTGISGGSSGIGSATESIGDNGGNGSTPTNPRSVGAGGGGGAGGTGDKNGGAGGNGGGVPGIAGCFTVASANTGAGVAGIETACNPAFTANCVAGLSGTKGSNGTNGALGCIGSNGSTGIKANYWNAGSQGSTGTDGQGGRGGKGGGGGAGEGGICIAGTGASGGGGAGAGAGGFGGTGGFGGGSSYAIYIYSNGASGTIDDCNLSSGSTGIGGNGGNGGNGGQGRFGGIGGSVDGNFEVGCGGNGGNVGDGGKGGSGGNGQNGESIPLYVNGTSLVTQNINFNLTGQLEIRMTDKNCPFDTISFSTLGAIGLWNFGMDAASGIGNPYPVVYNNPGRKDITIGVNTYKGFTYITSEGPARTNAGKDSSTCGFMILYGNNPILGTGEWIPVTPGTTVFDSSQYNTTVGLVDGINKLVWTISYGSCCPPTIDTITIIKETSGSPASSISVLSDTICSGELTTLSLVGGSLGTDANWYWYTGSCGGSLIDSGATISVSPTTVTTYYVRAEGNCSPTSCISKSIFIRSSISAPIGITSTSDTLCTGMGSTITLIAIGPAPSSPAQRAWYSGICGGTFLGYGNSISVSSTSPTVYFLRNESTCDTSSCITKFILTANPSIIGTSISKQKDTICQGENNLLRINGGTLGTDANWTWYSNSCGGTPILSSNLDSLAVSPSTTTTYFARAEGYCNTTSCLSVTVYVDSTSALPDSIVSTSDTICFGDSSILTVAGGNLISGDIWLWYDSYCGGIPIGSGNSITVSPSYSSTYFVKIQSNRCSVSECISILIDVKSSPVTLFSFDDLCKDDEKIYLDNGSPTGGIYSGSGVSGDYFNPSISGTGNHIISYIYTEGSCTVSVSDTIIVKESCLDINELIKVNTFSPNGDGVNDTWNINLGTTENTSFSIFNKWGELVFETEEPIFNWDGKYIGSPLPVGSYFYILEINESDVYKGSITIIR